MVYSAKKKMYRERIECCKGRKSLKGVGMKLMMREAELEADLPVSGFAKFRSLHHIALTPSLRSSKST